MANNLGNPFGVTGSSIEPRLAVCIMQIATA